MNWPTSLTEAQKQALKRGQITITFTSRFPAMIRSLDRQGQWCPGSAGNERAGAFEEMQTTSLRNQGNNGTGMPKFGPGDAYIGGMDVLPR